VSPGWIRPGSQRNFLLGVLNGLFFTLAETLIDPTLVLVAFVSRLTESPVLIGLVAPLRDGAWYLPQLLVSGYAQSQPYKLGLYRRTAVVRLAAWAGLALAAFALTDPGLLLIAFFLTFGVYAVASGAGGLAFMEVVGKAIPAHRRTVFFAWRLFTGGMAALGAAAVVRWLLAEGGPLSFPRNFGLLFVLGWAAAAAGLWAFQAITEEPDRALRPRASGWAQLQRAWKTIGRDPAYGRFMLMRGGLGLAGASVPFFALYAQTAFGAELSMVGTYLAVYAAASLLANIVYGRLAARLGNRGILLAATGAGLLMTLTVAALPVLAAFCPVPAALAAWWLTPAFALAGLRESGLGVAGQPLLLEIAPAEERSLYLGFTNTVLGVLLLSTGLSGVVVAALGFPVLLGLTIAAHAVALVTLARLVTAAPPAGHHSE
jgi:hypothetical protein